LTTPIQLIVGLANPGSQYAATRHNAGAWFLDLIAAHHKLNLRPTSKLRGVEGTFQENSHTCHLFIPNTYMNQSGLAVKAYSHYHKIPPSHILIAHDDIDLKVGTIRLKFDGGDGGHNGLKDIISHLHTKQFYRLRIGVGRPTHSTDVVDYVLKRPSVSERTIIDNNLTAALTVLPHIIAGDIAKAMQLLHTENT
jgi:PTH1 family peptidyl-tRNA hydrolase